MIRWIKQKIGPKCGIGDLRLDKGGKGTKEEKKGRETLPANTYTCVLET
jgi:hypothetical protein